MTSSAPAKLVGSLPRFSAAFGANIIAYDPFPALDWAADHGIHYTHFDTLLAASDILSLHLPLISDTFHLLSPQTLAQAIPGVFIANTSRGRLIDTTALILALKSGHIGSVALDVYAEEGNFFHDLSGQVLLDDELSHLLVFPKPLITAHQAFLPHEALSEIARAPTMNFVAQEPTIFEGNRVMTVPDGLARCSISLVCHHDRLAKATRPVCHLKCWYDCHPIDLAIASC